ncbi:Crp/Fnr family transcriptional regulator [Fulvivirga lutea]|uniref:Crp/Fnr family transcriptional regulator n=1 Tax=Fulvivirga lutea TaxID=2810512 RepID=A0A974WK73_9BACT|nr:Crp/Fnr family transcriptional regulator [Fulvivirga lutea]QSE98672.1 Crp/Fnr family transcriptional regulator [Fulvivirga lutea]
MISFEVPVSIELDSKDWDSLFSVSISKIYKRKEFLVEAGKVNQSLFLIQKGAVKKTYTSVDGKESIFEFAYNSDWIFDVNGIAEGQKASKAIQAIKETHAYVLNREQYVQLSKHNITLKLYFDKIFSKSLLKHEKRMKQLLAYSAQDRYKVFQKDYPGLELLVPQNQIAAYLGISPEFLSVLRNKRLSGRD